MLSEVRKFICKYIQWLVSHDDIELDPLIEFEIIRVLFDVYEDMYREEVLEKK